MQSIVMKSKQCLIHSHKSWNNPNDAKLEQESWQAELIISGVAILGALLLPELVDRFGQWALIYFSEDLGLFLILFLFSQYFICGSLIFGFVVHFILQGIWIGLIGLNSF